MKLLVVHSSSDLYGASKILLTTLTILQKNGYDIRVVLSSQGELSKELAKLNIPVNYLSLGIIRRKYFTPLSIINRVRTIRLATKEIKKIIQEEKINLLYSNTTAVLAGAFAAKQMGIPHIWHIHEIVQKPFFLFRGLSFLLTNYADKIIVVSQAVHQHWAKYIPKHKLHLIYNGINPKPYQQVRAKKNPNQPLVIGMIGRVHPWKGQDYFLRIAAELIHIFPQLQFKMVGDAFPGNEYLYQVLDQLKNELQLNNSVENLGYRTDIAALLHQFDIFILPSTLPDPFPTVVLEAMSASCAIVATNHGGVTEMINHEKEGVFIPFNNARAAANLIAGIITNTAMRESMGLAAAKKVETEFSLAAFEKRILNIF